MTDMIAFQERKKTARIAGFWYLIMGITSAFAFMCISSKFIVPGDAARTAEKITASSTLYMSAVISNLIGQIAFIFLVLALYRLLKDVNKKNALLMTGLVMAAVPVMFLNILNQIAPLLILNGESYLKVFNESQLNALAMLFLKLYEHGVSIVEIFWGLWLLPFGALVFRSGFIPKILGVLLVISGVCYTTDSLIFLTSPALHNALSNIISIPEALGEISTLAWLLIKGVRIQNIQIMENTQNQIQ